MYDDFKSNLCGACWSDKQYRYTLLLEYYYFLSYHSVFFLLNCNSFILHYKQTNIVCICECVCFCMHHLHAKCHQKVQRLGRLLTLPSLAATFLIIFPFYCDNTILSAFSSSQKLSRNSVLVACQVLSTVCIKSHTWFQMYGPSACVSSLGRGRS